MKNNIYISDDVVGKKCLGGMKMEFCSLMLDKSALYTMTMLDKPKKHKMPQ